MAKKIILPRSREDGKPRISYSQITAWNEAEAFNKIVRDGKTYKLTGKQGYILNYFFGYEFPPSSMDCFAEFGKKVEDAICTKDFSGFSPEEEAVLRTITPIGNFQHLVELDFGDFCLEGFLDDTDAERNHLRDYKTASASSVKKYHSEDYEQLAVYALDLYRKTGHIPEKMEVVAIERKGSPFQAGGCNNLAVGENVWYIPITTDVKRLKALETKIIKTVNEISECYQLFLDLNEI